MLHNNCRSNVCQQIVMGTCKANMLLEHFDIVECEESGQITGSLSLHYKRAALYNYGKAARVKLFL